MRNKDTYKRTHIERDFALFLLVSAFYGVAMGIHESTFNNFVNDTYHVSAVVRGWIEFPREMPGALVAIYAGVLIFMGDIRLAALANFVAAIGIVCLGLFAPNLGYMTLWMAVMSSGIHMFLPLNSSIGMGLAEDKEQMGKRLGQFNSANTAAYLGGCLIVWCIFKYIRVSYGAVFVIAGIMFAFAGITLYMMKPNIPKIPPRRLILRKEYGLFYLLNIVFGARKQIFLTFGPWVLIKIFNRDPSTFAVLGIIGATVGIWFKPFVGYTVDIIGEKKIILIESFMLIFICAGYALAQKIGSGDKAVYIVFFCFIIDQILLAVSIARATYMKKIAVDPEDVTPTLSMGISMDHVISMLMPAVGGVIWEMLGYEYVFFFAGCIALINIYLALRINIPAGNTSKV